MCFFFVLDAEITCDCRNCKINAQNSINSNLQPVPAHAELIILSERENRVPAPTFTPGADRSKVKDGVEHLMKAIRYLDGYDNLEMLAEEATKRICVTDDRAHA